MLIAAALLAAFGVAGAALVAVTHLGTAERIAANERQALLDQIDRIVPAGRIDNDPLADTIRVRDPQALGAAETVVYRGRRAGEPAAAIFSPVEAKGYAGPIRLIVAVLPDGRLGGVRVLGHKETPGLGDKIEETKSDWVLGFDGRSLGDPPERLWQVKRDGGVFDQFTGATVTPRSIVAAVRQTLHYAHDHWGELFTTPAADEG
jgi:electron transport complex protein RnfG